MFHQATNQLNGKASMTDAQTINSHAYLLPMNIDGPGMAERRLDAVQVSGVVETYRAALQRLIGRRTYADFELLLLRNVGEAVVSLRRHGIGMDSCVALAASYALDCIEQRADATNGWVARPEEGEAIDALLRAHDDQLCSERLAPLLVQAIVDEGKRGLRPTGGRRRAFVMERQRGNVQDGVRG